MAILDCLPGIEVTVWADGETLEEYDAENDIVTHEDPVAAAHQQSHTVTKYIESTTGQVFLVKVSVKAPYKLDCPNVSFRLCVDGQWVRSPLMTTASYARREWCDLIEGPVEMTHSRGEVTIMKFAEIHSSRSLPFRKLESRLIRVQPMKISRVQLLQSTRRRPKK